MNEINSKTHIVDVLKAKFRTRLADSINMENIYFDSYVDCATNDLIYQVEMFLLSNTHKEKDVIDVQTDEDYLEFPSSWWQHVRMNLGLSYKRKKYTYIKTYTTTKITTKTHLCPHTVTDPNKAHVQFVTFTSPNQVRNY